MSSLVRQISRHIRHLRAIENWNGLWDILRGPYHTFLNVRGGVKITVANCVTIRIPAEYGGHNWETYETETVRLAVDWARTSNSGLFLDIGSALGIFSAVVLFANSGTTVVAFDSDLASLVATRRFCNRAKGSLFTVYGFVTDSGLGNTLSEAIAQSELTLQRANLTGDVGTTRYVCLNGGQHKEIPRHCLDDLLRNENLEAGPILIKCDVEGAELMVLRGARKILAEYRPTLLLSLHPEALPQHGHTKEGVFKFVQGLGYKVTTVSIDHEEHWWCSHPAEPKRRPSRSRRAPNEVL
jgi:FkbM family methyltransferase